MTARATSSVPAASAASSLESTAVTGQLSRLRVARALTGTYFNSTAILSDGVAAAFSSACVAAPAIRTSSAFALV